MIRIHDFVPPVVQKIRSRLRRHPPEADDLRNRTFSDYAAAASACSRGWDDDSLAESVVADAKRGRDSAPVTPLELRAIHAVAWTLAEGHGNSGSLRVIEFGGSAGFNYSPMQTFFPAIQIQWAVVETPAMARSAIRELTGGGLSFFTTPEEAARAIGAPDLIFSSGALQYAPDPLTALSGLLALKAPRLVLFRTALNDAPTSVYAVQEAMLSHHLMSRTGAQDIDRKVRYPVTFVPRASFTDVLRGAYDIVAEIDEGVLNPLPAATHGYAFFCRRREAK